MYFHGWCFGHRSRLVCCSHLPAWNYNGLNNCIDTFMESFIEVFLNNQLYAFEK